MSTPVSGQVDRAGGIAVRLSDPDDYYVVRAKVLSDAWHTLGIRAESDRFAVSFDGKPLFTAGPRTFSAAGKVALWTKARQRHPFRRAHNSHTGLRRARRCRRSGH